MLNSINSTVFIHIVTLKLNAIRIEDDLFQQRSKCRGVDVPLQKKGVLIDSGTNRIFQVNIIDQHLISV